ncbi:MAG: cobalamin biosynthesis protein [Alphaproteobacteria bacterium]|nr:cobalamin biosynthesis protein [Alphaproteobacteria bacterium]
MTHFHENIAVLLLFFVVHLLIGAALMARTRGRPWLWTIMESAAGDAARRLNRGGRSDSDRIVRGAVVFVVFLLLAYGAGSLWALMSRSNWGWAADLFLLSGAMTAMAPVAVMRGVGRRLADQKTNQARDILARHLREDLTQADAHMLARKAVEYGIESLCVLLVGPALAFALFGAVGVFVYVMVMAQHRIYGHIVPAQLHFGATVRAAERLVNLLPAVVTSLLVVTGAAVVSRGKPAMAATLAVQQAGRDDSLNRGMVLAAAAGGLGLALGGPRRWADGQVRPAAWLGAAAETARTEPAAVRQAGLLAFVAFLLFALGFSMAFMMRI